MLDIDEELEEERKKLEASKRELEEEKKRIEKEKKKEQKKEEVFKLAEERKRIEEEKIRLKEENDKMKEMEKKIEEIKSFDIKTVDKCLKFLMSDKSVEYLSLFPRNDEDDIENDLINTLLYFFMDFSINLFPPCAVTDEVKKRQKNICERLEKIESEKKLFSLFNNYKKSNNRVYLSVVIGRLNNHNKELPSSMWKIIDPMKDIIERCCEEKEDLQKDAVNVLRAVTILLINKENKKHLFNVGFLPLLLRLLSVKDMIIVQHAVAPLCSFCNLDLDDIWNLLLESRIWNILTNLFKRLTFSTSKLPTPYKALESAVRMINNILFLFPSSHDSFIDSPLIPVILGMITEGSSLVISGPLTDNLKNILDWISWIIYFCNNKPSGQIKLQKFKAGIIIKNALNVFKSQVEKGKLEFNYLIKNFDKFKDL
jgi:hypothetical protein